MKVLVFIIAMLLGSLSLKSQDVFDYFLGESKDTITIKDLFNKSLSLEEYSYTNYDDSLVSSGFNFDSYKPISGTIDSLRYYKVYKKDSLIRKIQFQDKDIGYEICVQYYNKYAICIPYIYPEDADSEYTDKYIPRGFIIYDLTNKINVFFGINPLIKNPYKKTSAVYMTLILDCNLEPLYRVNWFKKSFVSNSVFFKQKGQLYEKLSLYGDPDCIEKYNLDNLTIQKLIEISKYGIECPILTNISAKPKCSKMKPFWKCGRYVYYYD